MAVINLFTANCLVVLHKIVAWLVSDKFDKKDDLSFWEMVKFIITVVTLVFLFKAFFYETYEVPTSSMENTLMVGDKFFVSKMSYGINRYAFHFSVPFVSKELWEERFSSIYQNVGI